MKLTKADKIHLTKIRVMLLLTFVSFFSAIAAEMFDSQEKIYLELYFGIGMTFTLLAAFFIGIWTFLDWREEMKKHG